MLTFWLKLALSYQELLEYVPFSLDRPTRIILECPLPAPSSFFAMVTV